MAEVKTIKIDVDTKQATKAMDDLANSTKEVAQEFDNAATFAERYGEELQPLTTRMGEAEDRLYELANAGQTATQEYKDLLKTVGDYRKVQIQTDMAVDAAASTFSSKLGGALGGVTSGFSIAQGAMGAFGVESEDIEKQLLKVQSAMAIADGVKGFREAIPAIRAFGTALKAAIGSTGIGLLVVALGALAAYWDDIKGAVSGVSEEQEKLNMKSQANVDMQQKKFDSISGQENILRLQGKTEKQITEMKLTQIQAVIKATEAQLAQQEATKKAEVAATKRNQDYLKLVFRIGLESAALVLRYLSAPIDLAIMGANKVAEVLGFGKITAFNINEEITKFTSSAAKSAAKYFFDPVETATEADKTIQETKDKLTILKNQAAGFQLEINNINKPAPSVVKGGSEKVVQSASVVYDVDAFDAAAYDINEIDEQLYSDMAARDALEIAQMQAHNQEMIDGEIQLQQDLTDAAIQGSADRITQAYEEQKAKEAIQQQNIDFALQGIAIIKSLFEKSKGVQKASIIAESALGIAKMIISNKTANLGALATPLAIATGGVSAAPTIAVNNISTGLGIAANLVATGKALKALGGGSPPPVAGIGGGGGGGIGGGTMAPNFNVVGNSGMNQLAQIQQTPMQAYVVSGEVTSAQALDRNRIKNATL